MILRSAWIRAKSDCEVAEISYGKFLNLVEDYPDLILSVSQQMASRLRRTTRKVGDLAFLDVTGRVARTLLDLAKEPDAMTHPDGMQIKITRQEIGRIVLFKRNGREGAERSRRKRSCKCKRKDNGCFWNTLI